MSIRLMSKVFESDLPATEKLMLLAMADWASDTGESIYPSIETLHKKTSLSEPTVHRTIKSLQDLGYLSVIKKGGGRKTNQYKINVDKFEQYQGDTPAVSGRYSSSITVTPDSSINHQEIKNNEPALNDEEERKEDMSPRTADDIRAMALQSMCRGAQNTDNIRATVEKRFHIAPNWRAKNWCELLLFIKEHQDKGETLDAFADWWFETDWRGKQGAPPTCGQIHENWPRAFVPGGDNQGIQRNPDGSFN